MSIGRFRSVSGLNLGLGQVKTPKLLDPPPTTADGGLFGFDGFESVRVEFVGFKTRKSNFKNKKKEEMKKMITKHI